MSPMSPPRRPSPRRSLSRRSLLRSTLAAAGVGAIGLPLLPSLLPRHAAAAPGGFPKRFIALFSSNGSRFRKYYPNEDEIGALPWIVRDAGANVRELALADVPGDRISAVFGPEWNALRGKVNLVRGLDLVNGTGDHYPSFMLSGHAGQGGVANLHESIDQILARSAKVYDAPPHVRSLHLQARGPQSPGHPISVDAQLNPIPNEIDPATAYAAIFGGLPAPDAPDLDVTAARRASVLTSLQADYLALRDNPRLGQADRQRLDSHVTLLDDLASRLSATTAAGCVFPEAPIPLDQEATDANLPQITKDHMDLIVAAIKCDLTRVVAFQMCSGTDTRTFSFLGSTIAEDHHDISHDYSYAGGYELSAQKMGLIGNWYAQQVAYLLEQLDVVEDPLTGATYLDNSIVYWGNEFGSGGSHYAYGMPVLLAGGGGGALRTGLYLDYREVGRKIQYDYQGETAEIPDADFRGRCYNELLVTLLQGMGLEPADYESGGVAGIGDYSGNYLGQYDLGDRRSPLPFLTPV